MRLVYLNEENVINIDKIVYLSEWTYNGQVKTRVYLDGAGSHDMYVELNKPIGEVVEAIEERAGRTVSVTRQGVTYDAAV